VRASIAAATVALALARTARAAADSTRQLELVWDAPAECPDATQVRAQVEALVSNDDKRAPRSLRARAQVRRGEAGSWHLIVVLASERTRDERELVGDSCQALVDSVAVMLALQLSPTDEATPPSPAPKAVRALPPPKPVQRVARQGAARPRARFQLGLAGVAESAALPRFALGGHTEVGWARQPWYIGVGAGAWLSEQVTLAQGRSGQGRFGFRSLSLVACHASWGGAVRLGPCLSAELGQLSAQSSNVQKPSDVQELWLAALGGIAFWAPLGSDLLFTSSLFFVLPLRRPHFVVEGIGEIHQPRVLGARSALGLAIRF
jgi:hypothetical protein